MNFALPVPDDYWPFSGNQVTQPDTMSDGNRWPRISIVTPSFNQCEFLEKTLLSVLNQGYPNLEYIVIDGGSTDGSPALIEKYADRLAYRVSEPDRGQAHALNKGFARCSGEILAWINSDDYYMPGVFHYIAEAFAQCGPQIGALVGDGVLVDRTGRIIHRPKHTGAITRETLLDWLGGYHFLQPSCFFRRQAKELAGEFREDLYFAMDLDLWIRMAEQRLFGRIEGLLSHALSHACAKTTANNTLMQAEQILVFMDHGERRAASKALNCLAAELAVKNEHLRLVRRSVIYRVLVYPFSRRKIKQLKKHWKERARRFNGSDCMKP